MKRHELNEAALFAIRLAETLLLPKPCSSDPIELEFDTLDLTLEPIYSAWRSGDITEAGEKSRLQ